MMKGVAGFHVRDACADVDVGVGVGVDVSWPRFLRGLGTMEAQKLGWRMVGRERWRVCVCECGGDRCGMVVARRVQWMCGRASGRRNVSVRGRCRRSFVASIVVCNFVCIFRMCILYV